MCSGPAVQLLAGRGTGDASFSGPRAWHTGGCSHPRLLGSSCHPPLCPPREGEGPRTPQPQPFTPVRAVVSKIALEGFRSHTYQAHPTASDTPQAEWIEPDRPWLLKRKRYVCLSSLFKFIIAKTIILAAFWSGV